VDLLIYITYMAIQAVHLELVKELSAELFLDCLRRFIARRGKCPSISFGENQQWM